MKKLILLVLLSGIASSSFGQPLNEKLYYTCKVWGFAKYYHSEVSNCHVNWDSVLLRVLPMVRSASTTDEFNDALDTMLLAAGPMALATTAPPVITDPELLHNRDWSWTGSPVLRADVQVLLDTIKNNYRPHATCQVDYNMGGSTGYVWNGYLKFPQDTIMLHANVHSAFPDADHLMLMLFKTWNITRYFNPYNYVLTTSIDTTLLNFAPQFDTLTTVESLNNTYLRFVTQLDDAHVEGLSYLYYEPSPPGIYRPRILLRHIEGQYVVVRSLEPSLKPGDALLKVDGLTIPEWEDSLQQFYSAGSIEIKRRSIADNILRRMSVGTPIAIEFADSTGTTQTTTINTVNSSSTVFRDFFYTYYYPADTLDGVEWSIFDCNVGYMNFGNLTDAGTDAAYAAMHDLPGIVIDIRNYPISGNAWALSDRILEGPTDVTKLTIPDVTYPGTYMWYVVSMGVLGNPTPYFGNVVVIVDQETQSAAEYTTMMLRGYPGCKVIGSHTAGADGNITYLQPAEDIRFGWTSLGVFYPNGDSTQRIGIVPDVYAYPTKEGVRHNRDYVLEQALALAGCSNGVPETVRANPTVSLFPNPASDLVEVEIGYAKTEIISISICDLAGRELISRQIRNTGVRNKTTLDLAGLVPGLYMARINAGGKESIIKLSKKD